MLRTFIRRGAQGTLASTALASTAATIYANTDEGAGFRREVKFWSRVLPVVADYYFHTFESSPYVKYQKITSSGLYEYDGKDGDDDESKYSSFKAKKRSLTNQLHEKNAPRILDVMLELKGLYIKLGQVLSVTALPIPEQYRVLFRTLQSDVPGHEEFETVVKPTLERELGKPLEELFEYVEPIPCGSASIGQAHIARLKDDKTDVVIKIQYPAASWQVPADIKCVGDFLSVCVWFDVVDEDSAKLSFAEFSRQFLSELDYDRERQNLKTIHESSLVPKSPYFICNVVIPRVYDEYCSNKVITMRYLPGPTMEVEAKRQLEMLGIKTSGGIAKIIRDSANDAVNQPNDESPGELVRRVTRGGEVVTRKGIGNRVQKALSYGASASGLGRFLGFDSVLWAVRGLKNTVLWSKGIAVKTIVLLPKPIVPQNLFVWAQNHHGLMAQTERLNDIRSYLKILFLVHGYQVFETGLYNADPHPGNIVLTSVDHENKKGSSNGKLNIGLIDYGQCRALTSEEQYKIANLILSVSRNEPDEVIANAFREMHVGTKNDSTEFLATFAKLMFGPFEPKHLDHSWHMSLHKLDRITYFPKELSMVYRTALLLRGLAISLQHNFSIGEEWKDYAESAVKAYETKNPKSPLNN